MKASRLMAAFLRAGVVAAGRQLLAVTTVTLLGWFLSSGRLAGWSAQLFASDAKLASILVPFLAWCYLVIAIGLALTSDKFIGATSEYMRIAAQIAAPAGPAVLVRALFAQTLIGSVALAVIEISASADVEAVPRLHEVDVWAGALAWPALLSIGVACIGATAHAAYRASR